MQITQEQLRKLSTEDRERVLILLKEKELQQRYNKLEFWKNQIYPWQQELANCTSSAAQILAMCANQIGKTTTGAYITACHLTGKYPTWWAGHRFKKPIKAWACGVSNETTRDILQAALLGEPGDPEDKGAGFVPKEDILDTTRKPQVPNAVQTVLVQHYSETGSPNGVSRLDFKAYEQGEAKFMGRAMDWIWLDEQPDAGIYTQCITRTVATNGMVMMTFTPEDGMTDTIYQFMHDLQPGQFLLQATWKDAPHLSEERKKQLLAQYPPHEAKMRTEGKPVFGSGRVFYVPDDEIICDPIEIPAHWPRICGIDFGWDHPTAAVWLAWDREANITYVYRCYRQNKLTVQQHAPAIKAAGQWIPCVWPHDGMSHEKGSGVGLADQYRAEGVNMTMDHFRNPLAPGEEGKGNIKVEPGINAMLQGMENGSFKVFSTCELWFEEKGLYHRDNGKKKPANRGKIVPLKDDLMSATRYAFQTRSRYAKTKLESNLNNKYSGKSLPVRKGIV